MYFASLTLPEFSGFMSVLIAMLAGFYALLRFVLKQSEKASGDDRGERQTLASAVERMAIATERSAREAEQRNGHLAEISITNKDAILEAINSITLTQKVNEQHVNEQTIDHLTVKDK